MEFQPLPTPPTTGEWPAVPPAPAPVKPTLAAVPPEPALIRTTIRRASLPGQLAVPFAPPLSASGCAPVGSPSRPRATDDSPTITIPTPTASSRGGSPLVAGLEAPIRQLRQALRRVPRSAGPEQVWQPRFASVTAAVILGGLVVLTLPLWIVLFRMTDPAANNGAGPAVGSLVALCMLIMGAFLTGAATWMILVEMRARVRMVDALSGVPDRDLTRYQAGFAPMDAPFDPAQLDPAQLGPSPDEMNQPVTAPIPSATFTTRFGQPEAASLDASGRLLASFGVVLRSFGQLAAQIAMLAVALTLFVGAIILSSS